MEERRKSEARIDGEIYCMIKLFDDEYSINKRDA